jgi:small-conductance mechanosensitive channel
MIRMVCLGIALSLAIGARIPAIAQSESPPPPAKVQALIQLLDDPAVREWIAAQHPAQPPAAGGAGSITEDGAAPSMTVSPGGFLDHGVARVRTHLVALTAALPTLPDDLRNVQAQLMAGLEGRGLLHVLLLVGAFLGLGWLVERLFRYATRGIQRWVIGISLVTVGDRLRAAAIRLCFAVCLVVAFALGSVGAFLLFDWPPLLRQIVLGYLLAILILRIALAFGRFALAPGADRFRLVPMNAVAANYWHRHVGAAVGWLATGWVTVAALRTLALPAPDRELIAYLLGIVLLAIGIESVWRRPPATLAAASATTARAGHGNLANWLLSGFFIVLWLLWVASLMWIFWLLLVAVGLPSAIRAVRRAVNHVLRPVGAVSATGQRGVLEISLERGLRAALIIGSAFLLADAWHVDLAAMTMQDTMATRLARGTLKAIVIALAAEFLWLFLRAAIDARLAGAAHASAVHGIAVGDEEERRLSRMRTLLPIVRNMLTVVIVVIAVLMILSSMGIEIAPLIAGAGVVGVAIGFGAQTLVKDVISGMFYLLDDAFRVGEYIQSGSYKGTVEAFSLRSVKLRHQRGPIFTVPFGELGAVQNMSRDWVIDKLTLGVSYDTDLEKARKLIKEIGRDLAANPEFAPYVIEPLKMQGVEEFGDYAIQIRMKMMTKPGHQFTIRRRALAAINQAFKDNGIKFAQPTVQVATGTDAGAMAAASQVVAGAGTAAK